MNKLTFFFILTVFISICSAQSQSSLQINVCPEHTVNFQGTCYQEIPNCQYYISGTKCIKCEQKYTLIDYRCKKTDKITQNLLFTLLIKKNQNSRNLTRQNVLTFNDVSNFNKIKNLASSKHQNMTSTQNQPILKNFLKTPFNSYFGFIWTNSKNKTFIFQYVVDQNSQCSELIADYYDPNLQNSWFGKINEKITEKYNNKLVDATLTKITSISKNLYKLHYYTDSGIHYISFIQKIPYLEIKSLEEVPWKHDQNQILSFIYSQHPYLATDSLYEIRKRQNTKTLQYDVKFKSGAKVVVQELPMQRERIIFFCRQENKTVISNSKSVGSFQLFRNKEDEIVRKILNHVYTQFKFLKNSQVTRIEYQIVSGTNFLIYLKDDNGNDQYVCKVFYSLTSQINILEIYMNSVLIHTQPLAPLQIDTSYDYINDPIFQIVNESIAKSLLMNVTKDILYVNKLKKTNDINTFFQFQIVYDQNTFVTVTYYIEGPRKGQIKVRDLVNKGDLDFDNFGEIRKIANFLSNYRKWLNPLLVTYMKQTKPQQYLLKGITGSGSYFFKLVDEKDTGLDIVYYELIDEKQHCLTHSFDDLQQFQFYQMSFIKKIMASQKIDPLSELISLSQGIVNSKITYRLLFSNPSTHQKTEVFASIQSGGLQVNKIQPQNNGFGLIIDIEFYAKAVEKAGNSFASELQDSKPLFGMMNSSIVNLYFIKSGKKKESVYLIQMNQALQNPTIETFMQQDYSQRFIEQDSNSEYRDCEANFQQLGSQCYERIKGCFKQIGDHCLICENQYSLVNNQCLNECSYFM